MDDQATIRTYGNTALPRQTAERPLVTFAVFAYNQERYIREAVEGAFSQTYSPLEIILSDDCSSDRTFEIMEEMAREYRGPHLVKVRRNINNLGTLAHLLSVARIADGIFLVVAAGDDISFTERTETMVQIMLAAPQDVAVASSDDVIFDDAGNIYDGKEDVLCRRQWFANQRGWFHGAAAVYRTETLCRLPIPNRRILHEDTAIILFFNHTDLGSSRIERPLLYRRAHAQNVGTIRLADAQDSLANERRRWSNVAMRTEAYDYAAMAIAILGGDSHKLQHKANFFRQYAKWPEMRLVARARLLVVAIRHGYVYGYVKSVLIRFPGRFRFMLVKKLSSIISRLSRA